MKVRSLEKRMKRSLLSLHNHWMSPSARRSCLWAKHVIEFREGLQVYSRWGFWFCMATAGLIESVKQKRPVYPSPGLRLQMLNIGWLKRFMKCLRSSTVIIILNAPNYSKALAVSSAFFWVFFGLRGPWHAFHSVFSHP